MNEATKNQLVDLARWMGQDRDIKTMAAAVCRTHGVASIAMLEPEIVEELHATAADLREQAPPEQTPGFLR